MSQSQNIPLYEDDKSIIPSSITCEIPDVPPINISDNGSKLTIKGNGISNNYVDDLPHFGSFSTNIKKWYPKNYVVSMETYGGTVTEVGKDVSMDLACLFYSCLKAISPNMREVSQPPWTNGHAHMLARAHIAHNFKKNMAEYLFTNLDNPSPEDLAIVMEKEMRYPNLTPREIYAKILINKIKIKYIAFNQEVKKVFYNKITKKYNLNNVTAKNRFKTRLSNALSEYTKLTTIMEELREKLSLTIGENNKFEDAKNKLNDPNLEYNIIFDEFSEIFPDPRYHMWTADYTRNYGPDSSNQYAFSHEIRQLPITMGIFSLPIMFDSTESDFRSDEFNECENTPLEGTYKAQTIIDQMVYRKENGIAALDLVCQITGYNAYCLDGRGFPHERVASRGSYTANIDIIKLIYDRVVNDRWPESPDSQDPNAPCFIIKFVPGHFESVSVLHKINIDKCNLSKKIIFQAQSVFSYYDDFMVAIRNEIIRRIEEEKISSAEKAAAQKRKNENSKIKTLKNFSKAAAELELEDPKFKEYTTRTEQLNMIKAIVESLNQNLDKEITIENYIDEKASEYDSRQNTPVKKQPSTEFKKSKTPSTPQVSENEVE